MLNLVMKYLTHIQMIPFELKENECVISYLQDGKKTKYFKVDTM